MISEQDRSGWFGASDTSYIMGNWNTKTFKNWWAKKLGINTNNYSSVAMKAGTYFEHAILDTIGAPRKDHQIIIPEHKMRINLDGDGIGRLDEVKTYNNDKEFKVTKGYWQQVQVQMFAKLHEESNIPKANIWSYGLVAEDYKNFFKPIDRKRVKNHPIEYDKQFINSYLKRVEYLKNCLDKGVMPDASISMR